MPRAVTHGDLIAQLCVLLKKNLSHRFAKGRNKGFADAVHLAMELIERKVSEFIGLPVVSMEGGIKMGTVKDVLIDTDAMTATALLISGDSGRGGLTFDEVIAIGSDAITVKSSGVIFWASATNPGPGREANEIKGLSVVNVTGDVVGTVHDIDLHGDHVKAIEVRLGGIFGIGATDTEILAKNIQSIGPKLITVNVPVPV